MPTGAVHSKPSSSRFSNGKLALPGVRHQLAVGLELVAPGVFGALETTARGELPFGFGRKLLAGPRRVRFGVFEGDVDDRVIVRARRSSVLGTARVTPVGAPHVGPPVVGIARVDRSRGFLEHDGRRLEHLRRRAGIVFGLGGLFDERDVARLVDEAPEVGVRDRARVHPEAVHRDGMGGSFLRVMFVRTHEERSPGNAQHVFEPRGARLTIIREHGHLST